MIIYRKLTLPQAIEKNTRDYIEVRGYVENINKLPPWGLCVELVDRGILDSIYVVYEPCDQDMVDHAVKQRKPIRVRGGFFKSEHGRGVVIAHDLELSTERTLEKMLWE